MPSWLTGAPLLIVFAVLFCIVFARAQATYWLGRAAAEGAQRSRWSARLSQPQVARAAALIGRWGAPVVTVSFLTVGFQTVANAAAGLARMPFARYLIAMVVGCVAWAMVYATVGIAAVQGAVVLAARSPWLLGLVVVALTVIVVLLVRRRSRRSVP